MGSDDDLVLGLGLRASFSTTTPTKAENMNKQPCLIKMEPSLTLGLLSGVKQESGAATRIDVNKACEDDQPANYEMFTHQASSHSVVSSFSNFSKRERDHVGTADQEIEVEKVSSRVSDEDEENTNTRKKLRLTKQQSALLEESFKQHSTLNPKQKQALARDLSLRPRQVEVWFQNRRARTKLKQTEVDCEFLKKCCETLTDENRRLQKELQELKAVKLAHPFYMHMPAATLTMCPSCERINGMATDNSPNNSPFSMAPKPHFYNPFTNPSAAC